MAIFYEKFIGEPLCLSGSSRSRAKLHLATVVALPSLEGQKAVLIK
jgi:hypothetical protein